MYYSKILLFF